MFHFFSPALCRPLPLLIVLLCSARLTGQDLAAQDLVAQELAAQELAAQDIVPPAIADPADMYRPTVVPDRIILTLTDAPATSQAVTWRTDTSIVQGVAEYTLAEAGPTFVGTGQAVIAETQSLESDLSHAHYHTVVFRDLEPSTQYLYRVGDGVNFSEWFQFTTAAAEPRPFSFIYFGDAQNHVKSQWSRVIREAFRDAPRASFLLHAGDLINRATRDQEWGEWHAAGGWINATIPSVATPGNHEYSGGPDGQPLLSAHWRPQFALPTNGPVGLEETCYFLDYQGVRIISINSNVHREEQAQWLDELLTGNPQRWAIITMHHPIYSAAAGRDNPQLRNALRPIFDKHQVDLVLQGHDHTYARSEMMQGDPAPADDETVQRTPAGTVYVVSVSGPKMYDLGWRPFMKRVATGVQLYQIVTVDGDELRFEARLATGELYDAFTLRHRPGEPNEMLDQVPSTLERRLGR